MVDKHCEKHSRFHYSCKDCREAAKEFAKSAENKRLYPDYDETKEKEVPSPRPEKQEDDEGRYKYVKVADSNLRFNKRKIRKYAKIIVPFIIILFTILSLVWFWPNWYGPINLNTQLYSNKAGGLDYGQVYFLNMWSTNFFFNKTCLMTAIIGSLLMSLPPNRNLLTIIGTKLRFGKPSTLKCLIFWWSIGFFIFYLFGYFINTENNFAWAMYLIETGELQFQFTIIFDSFNVLFNPTVIGIETIFVYSNIILPLIYFVIGVLLFRATINIASNLYLRRNDYNVISNAVMIVGLIFGLIFFALPTYSLNGLELIQSYSIIVFFIGFMLFGLAVYAFGKHKVRKDRRNYKITKREAKRIAIPMALVLFIGFFPLFYSIPSYVNLNNTATWNDLAWNKGFLRQITWTQSCAGLDTFEELSIQNYTDSTSTSDLEILSQIRQYDQGYAIPRFAVVIGTTFEGLADSDIVYINGTEYWVAPKTIKWSELESDPTQIHTELYDHVEGFLAMETSSGKIVNVTEVFNISEKYPIFFGEHERQTSTGAYDPDILLGTDWRGSPFNEYNYEGAPDGVLSGLEAWWFTTNLGLLTYAYEPTQEYLINRNIKTRVNAILMPGLEIDYDPYLVFNMAEGKMYYAASIYTSIFVGSYSQTPIYRFLGVCLVDVLDGVMNFYKNPALVESTSDPTYNLWKAYMRNYNWQNAPEWLASQLRYPESLFELQLEAYYKYHVTNPTTWKRGDDFHERPENGDLFYVETDLGNGIEYVGMDLVEYYGQQARRLAGFYVVRHGTHFGEIIFYSVRESEATLIGPKTARDTYEATDKDKLNLIEPYRLGNTLIYPMGDSLYYYVPVYATVQEDLQSLSRVGLVNAITGDLGVGGNISEAYNSLNIGPPSAFNFINSNFSDGDGAFYLNWTTSIKAEYYELYNSTEPITDITGLEPIAVGLTTTSYYINENHNGTFYYRLRAYNDYGQVFSNLLRVNITSPIFIDFDFSMESVISYPANNTNDYAKFHYSLENIDDNIDNPGYQIVLNLTIYSESLNDPNNIKLLGLASISNFTTTYNDGYSITFTLFNATLHPGELQGFSAYLNCTQNDLLLNYKCELFVDGTRRGEFFEMGIISVTIPEE
ncbi:MAG: UPF0182 family protein [Candidatus Lokiarchaeota archaeon]|nr:UPF0182 family protein [Candidatus Lokiarchaeota archaeon]